MLGFASVGYENSWYIADGGLQSREALPTTWLADIC